MAVGASVILEQWFRNKEMALAMALNLAVSRIGSVINNFLSPLIADSAGVAVALWFGALVCAGSLACTMVIVPLDRAAEKRIKEYKPTMQREGGDNGDVFESTESPLSAYAESHKILQDGLEGEATRIRTRSASSAAGGGAVDFGDGNSFEDVNPLAGCKYVRKFSVPFWLLTSCCLVIYGDVIPFNSVASGIFMERDYFVPQPRGSCALESPDECPNVNNVPNEHCETGHKYQPPLKESINEDKVDCTDSDWKKTEGDKCAKVYCKAEKKAIGKANTVYSIPYLMSGFLSPFCGGAVDKVGGRAFICVASGIMLIIVHALLGFTDIVSSQQCNVSRDTSKDKV